MPARKKSVRRKSRSGSRRMSMKNRPNNNRPNNQANKSKRRKSKKGRNGRSRKNNRERVGRAGITGINPTGELIFGEEDTGLPQTDSIFKGRDNNNVLKTGNDLYAHEYLGDKKNDPVTKYQGNHVTKLKNAYETKYPQRTNTGSSMVTNSPAASSFTPNQMTYITDAVDNNKSKLDELIEQLEILKRERPSYNKSGKWRAKSTITRLKEEKKDEINKEIQRIWKNHICQGIPAHIHDNIQDCKSDKLSNKTKELFFEKYLNILNSK